MPFSETDIRKKIGELMRLTPESVDGMFEMATSKEDINDLLEDKRREAITALKLDVRDKAIDERDRIIAELERKLAERDKAIESMTTELEAYRRKAAMEDQMVLEKGAEVEMVPAKELSRFKHLASFTNRDLEELRQRAMTENDLCAFTEILLPKLIDFAKSRPQYEQARAIIDLLLNIYRNSCPPPIYEQIMSIEKHFLDQNRKVINMSNGSIYAETINSQQNNYERRENN